MGACKVCGEIYGAFDLQDGVCKKCLKAHGTESMEININREKTIVKTYSGREAEARKSFRKDRQRMEEKGYHVISENFIPGQYTTLQFLLALLLAFLIIGIFIFIYMIIVKPKGVLEVTYQLREDSKVCPECAESVKRNARKCRFCGYVFSDE